VDELSRRGNAAQAHRLELSAARLMGLENRLTALSPLAVLQRGYAVVTKNKRVVASKSQVQDGDALRVRLRDGEFGARVTGDG
jgi:exodeoxyribonuclease VII large subunit